MVANGTTNAHGPWNTLAILEPSKPEYDKNGVLVEWKVQRNDVGTWRCNCKGFIFSGKGGAVRDCKHIREYKKVVASEMVGQAAAVMQQPTVGLQKPTGLTPSTLPQWDNAMAICTAMLAQARLIANDKQRDQMVEVLAKKLATYVPTRPVVATAAQAMATVGIRRITFDD